MHYRVACDVNVFRFPFVGLFCSWMDWIQFLKNVMGGYERLDPGGVAADVS